MGREWWSILCFQHPTDKVGRATLREKQMFNMVLRAVRKGFGVINLHLQGQKDLEPEESRMLKTINL
ncbi:MAG: hypothetical protein CMN21_00870 [Rubinisphaera sp.]|nr:hypothetical protein [Rubinisphaera sp.]